MSESTGWYEINCDENLTANKSSLVDHHSLLNLLNVLEQELESLNRHLHVPELKHYSEFCVDVLVELSTPITPEQFSAIESRFVNLARLVGGLIESHPEEKPRLQGVLEIIDVAAARIGEFREDRFEWQPIPHQTIFSKLRQYLLATEHVSRGKFHFTYPPTASSPDTYKIDFQVDTDSDRIYSPPILHDTIRDLVSNARKYSSPGKTITIQLDREKNNGLRLRVSDQGMGIPEDEVQQVVGYGYRATNALDRKSMGGGLGLTKAYHLSRMFNGRFRIQTAVNEGTTIELTLFPPV